MLYHGLEAHGRRGAVKQVRQERRLRASRQEAHRRGVTVRIAACLALALAALALAAPAAAAPSPVTLVPVARFSAPVGVVAAPGDASRLFVVEQAGRIVVRRGKTQSTFADLTDRVKADGAEQGLLGLAFAPDYATSGKLYVFYTTRPPAGAVVRDNGSDLVISELRRADADHADPASERVLLRIPHRLGEFENGGQLRFGPDGQLWIGTGDGGGDNDPFRNAQRVDPATNDASPRRRRAARQDPARRSAPGRRLRRRLHDPGRQPRLRPARGLGAGPAQPVAVLVRPPDRRPRHRRRRQHRLRGARPRAGRPTAAAAPTMAGRRSRAPRGCAGTDAPPAGCCTAPSRARARAARRL